MVKHLGYKIKFFVFTILILIITIEIISLIAVKLNLLMYNEEPGYFYPTGDKWRTEIMPWGAWHKPNFRDRHRKTCFDVEYESNNLGARDNEPYDENLPKNSIILIGDSMAEGIGVELEDTFAEVLEKDIGKRRISLSYKNTLNNPWDKFIKDHKVGNETEGTVKNITDYALFITIKNSDFDGMVHYKDLSWSEKDSELEKYK